MRFFLDENFPKSAYTYLTSLGHQVIDVRSTEKEGLDDISIFKLSQFEKAIFLTTDRDFFHTIPFLFAEHFGIVVIALTQPNRKNIMDKLKWLIENRPIKIFKNRVLLLKDRSYSVR